MGDIADHLSHDRVTALLHELLFLREKGFHQAHALRGFRVQSPLNFKVADFMVKVVESEGDVHHHLLQQSDHLVAEIVRFIRVYGQGADHLVIHSQRNGRRGTDTDLPRLFMPGDGAQVVNHIIADIVAAGADGRTGRPHPFRHLPRGDPDLVQKAVFIAVPTDRSDHAGLIVDQPDPDDHETTMFDRAPADSAEQRLAILGPHNGMVGRAQHRIQAVHALQGGFLL